MKKNKVIGLFSCMLSLTVSCTYSQEKSTSEMMTVEAWQKIPTVCSDETIDIEPNIFHWINDAMIYQNYFVLAIPQENRLIIYNIDRDGKSLESQVVNLPADENGSFETFVINENYLVVGYPKSNLVAVYRPDNKGIWQKAKEIHPPENSLAEKVKVGFGRSLKLEEDLLVIGAITNYSEREISNQEYLIDLGTFESFDFLTGSPSTSLYKTRLDREVEVERIDVATEDTVWGGSVALDRGRIAFDTLRLGKSKKWKNSREVNLLLPDGNLKTFFAPKIPNEDPTFGISLELKNNFLLVGTLTWSGKGYDGRGSEDGGAWLYDLEKPRSKPKLLTETNAYEGGTVALSEDWAVTSDSNYTISSKTIIRRINNRATATIEGFGFLTIEKNILIRKRNPPPIDDVPELFEVFILDKKAQPHLLQEEDNIVAAAFENGILATVSNNSSLEEDKFWDEYRKICLKQLPDY